jgi:hypothetical protein
LHCQKTFCRLSGLLLYQHHLLQSDNKFTRTPIFLQQMQKKKNSILQKHVLD